MTYNATLANIIADFFGLLFFIAVPVLICLLHWRHPEFFISKKKPAAFFSLLKIFFWVLGLSLFSEIAVCGAMLAALWLGHGPDNGFAVFCAFFLGWLYIWFTSLPVFVLYAVIRGIFCAVCFFRKKLKPEKDENQG